MGNKRYATLEDFYNDALNYNSIHNMAMGLNTSDSLIVKYLKRLEKERPKLREDLRDIWIDKRKEFLDRLRKMQSQTRINTSMYGARKVTPEYQYINFDIELVKKEYEELDSQIAIMQIELDKFNQTFEFEVDI